MRLRLIIAFALLISFGLIAQTGPHRKIFSSGGGGGTWTFDAISVRKTTCTTGGTTCSLNLPHAPFGGTGNQQEVVLITMTSAATGITISQSGTNVNGSGVTVVSGCSPTTNVYFSVSCAYVFGPITGQSVSVTVSAIPNAAWAIQADGAYKSSGNVSLDQVGAVGDASPTITNHVGPTLVSSTNDVIFQIARFPTAATAINDSYNMDLGGVTGINVAYLLNQTPSSSTPAIWQTAAGQGTESGNESAISFK